MTIPEQIKVLDHGWVKLIDHMGDDYTVAESALECTQQELRSEEHVVKLINRLLASWPMHSSPFEMVELRFHIKIPIFADRQIVRHRTASRTERSARYSEMDNEFYLPGAERIGNKVAARHIEESQLRSYAEYRGLLGMETAREMARFVIPVSAYTEYFWKINLHNLFNFLHQRLDKHAQWETRQYAEAIFALTRTVAPLSCAAFEEHIVHAHKLSRAQWDVLCSTVLRVAPLVDEFGLIEDDVSVSDADVREGRDALETLKAFLKLGVKP
jgi:thymidylate synthase (FAD)